MNNIDTSIIKNNNQAISSLKLPKNIDLIIKKTKNNSKIIVLVTGVFDVLHFEHINFLKKAKKLGDVLIVAIESDFRVKKIKGENRPINSQNKRLKNLLNYNITDSIFILPDKFNNHEDHLKLIKTILPNILAASSNTAYLDKKKEIMSLVGGKLIIVHQHNPSISSTKIINSKKL